ncbi:hypothetical protein M569_03049 [Genlisea aurea]|uniref:Protein YIP n=1 Tax=Genlisea aurea TaxID=192259 RepID=S8EGB6_9LAMI|nr:hypothetical protein M569_03049 [Genlisea aurea]
MEEPYSNIGSSSRFVGSVPAAITEDKRNVNPEGANLQIFPPIVSGSRINGYQTLNDNTNRTEQQPTSNWKGVFSISSYMQYFNVDTDLVLNRLLSSLNPTSGDFVTKIDANPDLYGLVWISTTLVFCMAALGNCAAYLMHRRSDGSTTWAFDVNYVNVAASTIYGYALVVPLGYYFLVQYMGGSTVSLIRFWCLWGYSLFVFILASFLLVIPIELLRWILILVAGLASATFVALNLKSYVQNADFPVVAGSAFLLQLALSIFIKVWFFS